MGISTACRHRNQQVHWQVCVCKCILQDERLVCARNTTGFGGLLFFFSRDRVIDRKLATSLTILIEHYDHNAGVAGVDPELRMAFQSTLYLQSEFPAKWLSARTACWGSLRHSSAHQPTHHEYSQGKSLMALASCLRQMFPVPA